MIGEMGFAMDLVVDSWARFWYIGNQEEAASAALGFPN
jgi:hypothetical protein